MQIQFSRNLYPLLRACDGDTSNTTTVALLGFLLFNIFCIINQEEDNAEKRQPQLLNLCCKLRVDFSSPNVSYLNTSN